MTHLRDFFMAELILFYISHTEAPRILEDIEPTSHQGISKTEFVKPL